MLIADLIKELQQYDPKTPVLQSRDSEGNGYHHVAQVDTFNYDPRDGYSVECIYVTELTPAMIQAGYTEEDLGPEGCKSCVVLFP